MLIIYFKELCVQAISKCFRFARQRCYYEATGVPYILLSLKQKISIQNINRISEEGIMITHDSPGDVTVTYNA